MQLHLLRVAHPLHHQPSFISVSPQQCYSWHVLLCDYYCKSLGRRQRGNRNAAEAREGDLSPERGVGRHHQCRGPGAQSAPRHQMRLSVVMPLHMSASTKSKRWTFDLMSSKSAIPWWVGLLAVFCSVREQRTFGRQICASMNKPRWLAMEMLALASRQRKWCTECRRSGILTAPFQQGICTKRFGGLGLGVIGRYLWLADICDWPQTRARTTSSAYIHTRRHDHAQLHMGNAPPWYAILSWQSEHACKYVWACVRLAFAKVPTRPGWGSGEVSCASGGSTQGSTKCTNYRI